MGIFALVDKPAACPAVLLGMQNVSGGVALVDSPAAGPADCFPCLLSLSLPFLPCLLLLVGAIALAAVGGFFHVQ